ncbi:hypothetical protein a10_08380 [Streptomyces acidiscabies]|nr:hypothetical protein a10_08380 [Streptomyces acidiscabies]GAV45611.1 hypothetical protein Saa2_08602 [Streptomyces acidiscabies]
MDTPSAQPPRPTSALGDHPPAASPSRRGRRRLRRALVLGFVVLAVCASVFTAVADPSPSPAPAPEPTTSATPSPIPTPSGTASSCPAADCIPQPSTSPSPVPTTSAMPPAAVPDTGGGGGISGWIAKGINSAITGFFKTIVKSALNPLPDQPSIISPFQRNGTRIGQSARFTWKNSRHLK